MTPSTSQTRKHSQNNITHITITPLAVLSCSSPSPLQASQPGPQIWSGGRNMLRHGVVSCLLMMLIILHMGTPTSAKISTTSQDGAFSQRISTTSAPLVLGAQQHLASNDWIGQIWQALNGNNDKSRNTNTQRTHVDTSFTAASSQRNLQRRHVVTSQASSNPTGETSSSSPASVQQPHTPSHASKVFSILPGQILNNAPPSNVPPARLVAHLIETGDDNHVMVSFIVGSSNSSKRLPDAKSVTLNFILDTGTSDLVLFNKSCTGSLCDNIGRSSIMQLRLQPTLPFGVTIDGETFESEAYFARNLITMPLHVIGTRQKEYLVDHVSFVVCNSSITRSQLPDSRDPTTRVYINEDYISKADGVLGLAYNDGSLLYRTFHTAIDNGFEEHNPYTNTGYQTLVNDASPFFSLNFQKGRFFVGGIDETYRTRLLWSDGPVGDPLQGYHSFHLYHFKICGVNMFENITTSWHALVDTGSSCLGLPDEFFDMVISWLPLQCNLNSVDGKPHVCYLTSDVRPVLPTLSFRLSERGQEIFISLSDLLYPQSLPTGSTLNRICLYRSESILQGPSASNAISFGSRVLHQLYAAFETQNKIIGFANINRDMQESTIQCASRVVCSGMQVHNDALNVCLPPPCADYYFFAYDPDTKECKLSTDFHVLTVFIIGVFIFAEIGLNEAVIYLSNKVNQNAVVVR